MFEINFIRTHNHMPGVETAFIDLINICLLDEFMNTSLRYYTLKYS